MRSEPGPGRLALGLFLLSAGVLSYELLLMRIFSVLMWYHFASLAIGLALLGLGAGGVAVGLFPRLRRPSTVGFGAVGFGAGVLLLLGFLASVSSSPELARATLAPFHQPFYRPFARPDVEAAAGSFFLRLAGLAVLTGLPFLGAGLSTAAALARAAPRVHRLYGATFLGSAAGCLGALGLLTAASAPAALGVSASLGFAGAACLWVGRRGAGACGALVAASILLSVSTEATGAAEIPFAQGRFEPKLLAVRWNPMSRVAAFPLTAADVQRPFGLSAAYRGPIPPQIGLVVDDSGYTNLYEGRASRENPEYYRSNLVALPFHLRPEARSLLLGPGGGKDLWIALSFPGGEIRAVEINPQVVEMAQEVFGEFTGRPYADPRVRLSVSDARRFAALDRGHYDVIGASAVFGRLPPAAGAFTLSEDLLHTREAFRAYWERLSPNGILSVTRFAYEQRALRLAALARATLDEAGVATPGAHVRVLADRGLANVMLSRSPFSPEDDRLLAGLAAELGFSFLYPAGEETALTRIVEGPDPARAVAELPFDVSPSPDDRPFFYFTLRPRDFLRADLPERPGFDNQGAAILRGAFLGLGAVTLCAIIFPLAAFRGRPGRGAGPALLFAGAIGVGFMALEIGTMKRVSLFLGHPVYAASATLFGFLLGGGAGSLCARPFGRSRRLLGAALVSAAALGLLHAFGTPAVLGGALGAAAPVRWALAAALILPLAFALGLGFPAGMALLGRTSSEILPWAWGVNGAASVLGSLGAVLVAMAFGYTATLSAGAALYLGAAATLAAFPRGGAT
jgi:hypothetical protein